MRVKFVGGTDVGVGVLVGGIGVLVAGIGVSVGIGVGGVVDFSNTATLWLEFISICAVVPSMLITGPTHLSSCQPCFGSMSMVTVIP